MRRRAKCRKVGERECIPDLNRKSRLLTTEMTKYRTRASLVTLVFSQPQIERVPRTMKDQIGKGEQQKQVPETKVSIPKTMSARKTRSYATHDKPPYANS